MEHVIGEERGRLSSVIQQEVNPQQVKIRSNITLVMTQQKAVASSRVAHLSSDTPSLSLALDTVFFKGWLKKCSALDVSPLLHPFVFL